VVKLQSELVGRTRELSTAKHDDLGLTLGSRSGFLVSLRTESAMLQSITETNSLVSLRLDTTQSTLESIQSSAQEMLESLLGSNAAETQAQTIQSSAGYQLSSLISRLNSSLGGDYVFAGANTGVEPMTDYDAPASLSKVAVDAAFSGAFGFTQSSPNVAGITGAAMQSFLDTEFAAMFDDPSWSDTWSSAADVVLSDQISPSRSTKTSVSANETAFRQLAQAYTMLADLGTGDLGKDAYAAVTTTATALFSAAIDGLTALGADVGTVQSEITEASEQMSLQLSLLETQVGSLENVDTYEVAARLAEIQTQLAASYSMTAQLRDLSLVYYL
jgi:flagellar hook-associated protein 3 FlgL